MALWKKDKNQDEALFQAQADCVPKFGTYCRTAAFEQRPFKSEDGSYPAELGWTEYHEAFQPAGGLSWSINKIKLAVENGETFVTCRPQKTDMTFMEALKKLAEYELYQKQLYPDQDVTAQVKELDKKHFKAFATREGVLWNEMREADEPVTLIHEEALPPGRFRQSAVEEARKIVEIKEALPEPAISTEADVLTAVFNRASASGNIDLALQGLKQVAHLDVFMGQLSSFAENLDRMIANPVVACNSKDFEIPQKLCNRSVALVRETFQTRAYRSDPYYTVHVLRWHGYAVHDLDIANEHLKKLEDTGQEAGPLRTLLYTFEMATHLLYAKSLFRLCQEKPALAEGEAGNIKTALEDAELLFTHYLDQKPREIFETLKRGVTSGGPPAIPAIVGDFQKNYSQMKGSRAAPDVDAKTEKRPSEPDGKNGVLGFLFGKRL